MTDSLLNFYYFLACMILALFVLVSAITAVAFYIRSEKCKNTIAPWGYMDWKCYNEAGVETNMSDLTGVGKYGNATQCTPLTDGTVNVNGIQTPDTLTSFEYRNKAGDIVTGNPSQERNPFDPSCINKPLESCPYYEAGDVYWAACHGGNLL